MNTLAQIDQFFSGNSRHTRGEVDEVDRENALIKAQNAVLAELDCDYLSKMAAIEFKVQTGCSMPTHIAEQLKADIEAAINKSVSEAF